MSLPGNFPCQTRINGVLQYFEIILIFFVLPVAWFTVSYNLMARDKTRVLTAWSDIDIQLKRRHDLIPKLIDAVKQYSSHEPTTLTEITELRSESESLFNIVDLNAIESKIGEQLRYITAIAEDNPDLKASQPFIDLQYNLIDVENRIQNASRYYNGAVRNFNNRIESFPDFMIARLFKFIKADSFELSEIKS